jgi:hypothetical protein
MNEAGFQKRTNFGTDGYKEPAVQGKPYHYVADLEKSKYYDAKADPQGIWKKGFDEGGATGAEKAVRDAGFHGYRSGNEVASFEKVKVRDVAHEQLAEHEASGGSTFSSAGKNLKDTGKYSVGAYPDRTETVAKLTPEKLEAYKRKNSDVLTKDDHAMGTWKNEKGTVDLDVAKLYENRDKAIAAGKKANQQGIFHLGKEGYIPTGGTGEAVKPDTQIKSATGNSGAFDPKNPSIANQTVKIGEGETHLTGDVNTREMPDKESKWVGMPRPPIRKVHGRIPAPQLNDMVDWYRANATPEQRMVATAHEIAHEHLQKVNGISMEGSSISLGHARIPGNYKDLSGAYLDTGKGIDAAYQAAHVDKLAGNRAPMLKFLSDYSTQMMGGRAIEEMLNVPAKEVKVHAKGDVNDVKAILANQGMHSLLMDNYLDAATERAKFILQEDWPKIQHMVAQAVQHYGGKIDAATLQKYREGGTYEPKK